MNTVLDINQKFSIDNTDKIIGLSSMCFDLSVYDIFGSLSTGAKLVEIEDIHDISYLERIVEKEGITVWNSVPAIMEMFLNGIGNERLFPTINTVLLSGDWIPVNMPNAIKKVCENARVVSLGGATEGSIWSIYYPVDYVDPEWKSIPYGKPLANQTYYVLNYEGRECPVGVSGELYIGGKGVAQGYFKDQEKTNKAFIVHLKYGRIYRTGDYGVLLKSGIIIFQGRKDSQIKIRGHRIEIGEIENQLLKHPKVKNCVVVDWEDDLGKKYLCGYFVSENNIDSKELQDMLRSKLPDYMIPKCFEKIGGIPLTANEKVDRNKLPKPEFKTKQIGKCIDPRTVKEKEVLKIWKEVLNLSDIGIYDDFYEMGGDSLSAMKVFSKLTQKYQISIKELYLYRNIASLSKMLRKKEPQIYFDFLKNQFKEMEHVLQYPTTEYLESYRNYLEKIDKDYNEIELEIEEEYRTMLFIGATGFLGSHILYEFLSNTDVEIYAIIRGQSKESAGKRLRETLEFFDKYNPAWEQRIHVVVGDASIPKFGLEEETYEILRSKVDCIFNCAAIVSHAFDLNHIKRWIELGADEITLAHHVNRDFKLLKKMLLYTKGKNVTLRLIANNLCLHMCPYSIMHGTVQGHFSCSDSCSRGDIDYCLMKCLSTKIEDMSNLISSDWIRPEDLCYYEKLCEETDNFNLSIKLVERTKSTKFLTRVVEAYARRQYKGNLLDILLWPKSDDMVVKTEPTAEEMKTMAELYNISQMFNYSKIFDLPNIYIDNTKLDGFLKKFVDDYACNHKICVSKQNIDVTDSNYCSYCSSWVQRAIIYNGEQVEKWIDNCREFEKALDRSEVFRSVL